MTARFAATIKHASPSDLCATTMMTVEMGLMSQWNVASRFISLAFNNHQWYMNMPSFKAALGKLKTLSW